MSSAEIQSRFQRRLGRPFGVDQLFDAIPDTVYFVKDHESRYVFVNRTLAERCGVASADELIGRTAGQVFPEPLGNEFQQQDLAILSGGVDINAQLELHRYANGKHGWCLTWKHGLRDPDGQIVGLSGISRDLDVTMPTPKDLAPLAKLLDFIRANLSEPLRLGELAKSTGLSEYQINHRIESLFGITPKQYISRCRIDAACHALEHSDATLADIALECGFSDQSAFTRQFGRSVGMTPKHFRDHAKGRRP